MTGENFDQLTVTRDHILRAGLPWRDYELTECGREVADVATTITRDQFFERIKRLGKQRTAFTVCMTCASTAPNYLPWNEDPVSCLRREVQLWRGNERMTGELRAIAALIAAHPDEFAGYLSGLAETVSLADRRRKQRR